MGQEDEDGSFFLTMAWALFTIASSGVSASDVFRMFKSYRNLFAGKGTVSAKRRHVPLVYRGQTHWFFKPWMLCACAVVVRWHALTFNSLAAVDVCGGGAVAAMWCLRACAAVRPVQPELGGK